MAKSQKQFYFYTPEGLSLVKGPDGGGSVLFRAAGQALAQRGDGQTGLYATDIQGSVLRLIVHGLSPINYTAYGYDSNKLCASLLRYCGQRKETIAAHYLLGDGYRALNSVLMRFNSPDSVSPFGAGGINPYCYCGSDPVNNTDPSGHILRSIFGRRQTQATAPMVVKRQPVVERQPTTFSSDDIIPFSEHIAGRPNETFSELIAYQGRASGKWIDTLSSRNSFNKSDRSLVEGVKVSLSRDVQRLVVNLKLYPASSSSDTRYVAAEKLVDGLAKVERLEERVTNFLRAAHNWQTLVSKMKKTRKPG